MKRSKRRNWLTGGGVAADEARLVERAFLDLAFGRLRLDKSPTPHDIEVAVERIDTGLLDHMIGSWAPVQDQPASVEQYIDVKPFSYEDWKRRHDIKD